MFLIGRPSPAPRLVVLAAILAGGMVPTSAQACTLGSDSITVSSDLSFGAILTGASGTATVSPSGMRSSSGAILLTSSQFSQGSVATFAVCSSEDTTADIALPSDSEVTLSDGNGHTMEVNDFTSSSSDSTAVTQAGSTRVNVGATLSVASTQAAGDYTGYFELTVTYE